MNRSIFSPARAGAILGSAAALLLATAAAAHTTPEPAIQAHQMLGPDVWSKVVELDNRNKASRYPSTLYATVFEFDNVLWFYTSTGTQPIERSRNRVDDYRDNLLPLLKNIERGFRSIKTVPAAKTVAAADLPQLENGCVIESIYSLEEIRKKGTPIEKARLLLYSATRNTRRGTNGNARGHAVLVYETDDGLFYVDPPEIGTVKSFSGDLSWDPKTFASLIEEPYGKAEIQQAFFVPVNETGATLAVGSGLFSGDE